MKEIPNKVNILGRDFEIIKENFASHANTHIGSTVMISQKIWLDTETHKQQQEETLIHEIIETIDTMCELGLEHPDMSVLSSALYQVLKENKLQFGE